MNMKNFKWIAILLLLAGNLFSCSDDKVNEEVDINPEKAILGKWELVLLNGASDEKQYIPTGFVEYLPDGQMAWYDYATKKYTVLDTKYWLEKEDNPGGDPYWTLYYRGLWIKLDDGTRHLLYPDSQGCDIQHCTFISNNRMGLTQLCVFAIAGSYTYIYKRKK